MNAFVNRIITAKDYAEREGAGSVRDRIMKRHLSVQRKAKQPLAIRMDDFSPRPVTARIEMGAAIADCECGTCEFVDPDEPIFYCFGCFNRLDGGRLRPVTFPEKTVWDEISRLVLLRPVDDIRGKDDCDRAYNARALILLEKEDGVHLPLTRSWRMPESIEDLHKEQDEAIEKYMTANLKKGGD